MTVSTKRRAYQWNYRFWVLETASWVCGTAFIDATTVLPVLVLALSHSPFLASLVISIRYFGQGWPQLFAASFVSGKARKPFFLLAVLPGRLALLWPAVILSLGISRPVPTLTAILLAYLAFWISEGCSIVPWVDMVGNTIPSRRRGGLFAAMYIAGGLLGIGAGLLVRLVLRAHRFHFPVGYGLLFVLAFFGVSISTMAIAFLREPSMHPREERYSTLALIKDIPHLLRTEAPFRRLIVLQALFGFALLPAPFYILFALHRVLPHAPGQEAFAISFFLMVQTLGMIVGNAVLGQVGDRYGNRQLLRVLAFIHLLVPSFAVLAGVLAGHAPGWLLYATLAPTFFGLCVLQGGTWMGVTNYLLDIAPPHDRPAFIAVGNALNISAIILPMLGGLLLTHLGYLMLFFIAIFFLALAQVLTFFLVEPRETHAYYHAAPPEAWG